MITLPIRGIVFDLDGVLIHSTSAHAAAFRQVFQEQGINDFAYGQYAGWRTVDVIADVLDRHGCPASGRDIAALADEKTRLARLALESSRPIAGHFDSVMAKLAANYRLGLASSGTRASVNSFLRMTGSRAMFSAILTGEDVVHAKPDPEIYFRSLRALGLRAGECLVVEDAVGGVEAARAAGIAVVGVAGTCSEQALRQAGANDFIEDLGKLPDLLPCPDVTIDRSSWTAIIPAAGRGSRLAYSRPKILYPLAGRLILDWLLELLVPYCGRLVFVLSPDGVDEVAAELRARIPGKFDIDYDVVIQPAATGMGDAVALALPEVRTPYTAILWGDQAAVRHESIQTCMGLHQGPLQPALTFPTVVRTSPYVCFDRDDAGRLSALRQAREGDATPETGESDSGFFCFDTERLRSLIAQMRSEGSNRGRATGEFNLLPVILLAQSRGIVLTPRLACAAEAIGINDHRDVTAAEEFLRSLHGR